ncbi:MAG: DUF4194 domain-containing protein [Ruminococcus flavefaciens]|nr:DUF4194 domain-containing protein [Ruminococcus flavefaciens]
MFKKAVRHLLDSTFILKEKEEKLYRFLARETNRFEVSQYLQAIGLDLVIEEKAGVAMLAVSVQDEDMEGIRRSNIIQFTQVQYHLLLVLWQAYLETIGGEGGTYLEMGSLVDRIRSYGIDISGPELRSALRLFKKHMFIQYSEDERGEDMKIRLYPSLQFGWDLPQFKEVADGFLEGAAPKVSTGKGDAGDGGMDDADGEDDDSEEDFIDLDEEG